jgi:hypothetical protein
VLFRDFSVNTFLCLFFLGAERGGHASMMTGRAACGAEDLFAGVDEALFDVGVSDGVRGDTRAASAVGGMFIFGMRLGGAVSALGLALALLELVTVHETFGTEGKGWNVEELLEGDRGFSEEDGVSRCLCVVPGDGSVRVLKTDGEVGKGGGLPSPCDPASFMNGTAFLECIERHNVRSKLVLRYSDTPSAGGATVTNEASKSEISSGACNRLAIFPIDETAEDVHGQSLSWEGSRGVHANDDVPIPTDSDTDEFGMVVERGVFGACEADAILVGVFFRVEVSGDRVGFVVEDLDDKLDQA